MTEQEPVTENKDKKSNNVLKDILIFLVILIIGYNAVLNVYVREGVGKLGQEIKFVFCASIIPDRITFFGANYRNISAVAVTLDAEVMNIIRKDFKKGLNGLTVYGMKMVFRKNPSKQEAKQEAGVILPYTKYMKIFSSSIVFEDAEENITMKISGIRGKSAYSKGKGKNEQFMTFEGKGYLNGKRVNEVNVKFFLYPHFKNKFFLNLFGTNISVKEMEPMFKKNNIKVISGRMNFVLQIKGDMRKIYVNNIMRFTDLKLREDVGIDFKYLFGVSVEQMVDFLSDSNGGLAVDFNYTLSDSQLDKVFVVYGEKFKESVGNRIKLGVVTAPVRAITDLIWNVTGGLFIK